jgi:signal transduction histidine kinase
MMLSLRTRLLFGVALWTFGLIIVLSVSLTFAWHYMPNLPLIGRRGSIHTFVMHTALALTVAFGFLAAGVWQVTKGLAGLRELRSRLAAVHTGQDARVTGLYVSEVQPVVDDLNALLEHRDLAVARAIAKAGDLAHGLKTPLAVLVREAEMASAGGHEQLSAAIIHQVERMRRQIDYHLAHARAAASGPTSGARSSVRASADGLARTLMRLHADRQLVIDVRVPEALTVRVQREDLDEMLGNLLDNACKWTRTRVVIDARADRPSAVITVDDDGGGIAMGLRHAVLERGVRADERTSGSGLGLAIVRDLAELYGGSIALDEAPAGGLRAVLTLPLLEL